eukprot:5552135-Amphidinium_carterae.1
MGTDCTQRLFATIVFFRVYGSCDLAVPVDLMQRNRIGHTAGRASYAMQADLEGSHICAMPLALLCTAS